MWKLDVTENTTKRNELLREYKECSMCGTTLWPDTHSLGGMCSYCKYKFNKNDGLMTAVSLLQTTAVQIGWLNNVAGRLIMSLGETGFQ